MYSSGKYSASVRSRGERANDGDTATIKASAGAPATAASRRGRGEQPSASERDAGSAVGAISASIGSPGFA